MTYTIALAQTRHPENGDVIGLVRRYAHEAHEGQAGILAFPESLMTRFETDRQAFLEEAQSIDGPFPSSIDAIAKEFGLWIVYTMNEKNKSGGNPYNTCIIVDSSGNKRGVYRKVHLFDSATVRESSRMCAANHIFDPIDTPFGKLGLGICYDLRFPELARKQALQGCDMLFYPAAWVDGPDKAMQWETLLRARAIEEEMFVAGICRADEGYVGESYVFAPSGALIAKSESKAEGLTLASIHLEEVVEVREKIPVLEHLRPSLYQNV